MLTSESYIPHDGKLFRGTYFQAHDGGDGDDAGDWMEEKSERGCGNHKSGREARTSGGEWRGRAEIRAVRGRSAEK